MPERFEGGNGRGLPAALGTRILESRRDRLLTLLLVPLVPCAGRLAVLMFVAAALFGTTAQFVVWGLIILSLVAVGLSGVLLNRPLLRGESPPFIIELPLYHLPNWRTIGLYT